MEIPNAHFGFEICFLIGWTLLVCDMLRWHYVIFRRASTVSEYQLCPINNRAKRCFWWNSRIRLRSPVLASSINNNNHLFWYYQLSSWRRLLIDFILAFFWSAFVHDWHMSVKCLDSVILFLLIIQRSKFVPLRRRLTLHPLCVE